MEFVTITALYDGKRYVAIYRKWFSEKLGAWELELVPGTLRWLTLGDPDNPDQSEQISPSLQSDRPELGLSPKAGSEPNAASLTAVPVPSAA